jgi:DNA-directed RNA polymerase beta' subunit
MNLFFGQCIQAQIELERIVDVKYQIITPKSSAPSISIKEDALAGSYNMTIENFMLDWRTAMNILSATKLDKYSVIKKENNISGKEVYSYIIPDNINSTGKAIIKNGIIEKGPIVDQTIGIKKKNNLIQLVWDEYGVDETVKFLNNIARLANNFNLYHGLSIGIGDLDINKDLMSKIYQVVQTKKMEVMHDISEVENNPDMMDEKLFELTIKQKLTIIRDDIGKLIFSNFKPNNNIKIMLDCGSKGNMENIAQMGGCLGNQDFDGFRMPKNYNNRSLPYFFQNDDSGEARGFIEGSFMNGINISEFFFHQTTGREGCIDSALKSVTYDTTIMIMENSQTKIVKIGEWIDKHLTNGYSNTPELIETKKTMNFELLNVKNMYIPTVDEDGKMSWGEITALTRHDSGNCIYEIITQSGRKVKVPESKSLLIWEDNKFIPQLTPNIKIGDKVPVTMNLSVPSTIINEIDMTVYFSKNEYIYGTDFIKGKIEMENIMKGKYRVPSGWWQQNNGTTFTLPYDKKSKFKRVLSGRSDISNIKEGYVYSYSTNRNTLIPDKFKLTRENGTFIGLYIADGNMYYNGSGYIQITKNNEAVLSFAEKYFDKFQIHHARQSKTTDIGTSNDVRGFSNIFAQFIEKIAGKGSANKQIPDFAFNAPEEFIIGLLDGYFSGDGTVGDNHIDASSSSEKLIDGLNILLTRLGIFAKKGIIKISNNNNFKANYDSYTISIRSQWAKIFKEKIGILINSDKNNKLLLIKPSEKHKYYEEINDVILDKIIAINKLDPTTYPKLYDLTVPSTYNFVLANGLGVRDTASSGYLQRKFIKATEDCMVKYDGTVRNAVERIHQFIYGDSGIDTVKQYDYKFKIMEMKNSEIANIFKFTKDELKGLKNFTETDNEKYFTKIKDIRDHLRYTQMKATNDYIVINTNYMLPVNIGRIIDNIKNKHSDKNEVINEPKYIIDLIEDILRPDKTRLYSMTEDEMKDTKSPKYLDDKISKTAFRYALYDALAPRKCIIQYNFSKKQLDEIALKIITSFNRSVVEPGEMVGILGAQSLGEPVTQMVLRTFHTSGIGANLGVPRMQEVFSLSKNIKNPLMHIFLDKEYREKKDYANKIASYIKFTTIRDLRTNIKIYYDPKPYSGKGSFMETDNVYNVFYAFQQSKSCCSNKVDGLPWLMRIEFDKEKLMNKEVSLLDIKSKFCVEWEKRYQDIKSMKRDKRQILDKITQIAVLTNTDGDNIPIMHIRFDMTNYNSTTLIDFMDMFVDDFKLKGMDGIDDILESSGAKEERILSFDNEEGAEEKLKEYVIYTKGINMTSIRDIIGVDLTRTFCNDIITIYEILGIEAARALIIQQITAVFANNGSAVNYQHISIFGDLMTNVGTLTSIDRHGLNKLDTDPLARASFEKTVEQLVTAAVFNEVDHMKSVSSRIMAGLCIKGGTGLCNLILDKELLENSEYTFDIGQLYNKTYEDIVPKQTTHEVDTDVFIPDF